MEEYVLENSNEDHGANKGAGRIAVIREGKSLATVVLGVFFYSVINALPAVGSRGEADFQ